MGDVSVRAWVVGLGNGRSGLIVANWLGKDSLRI